MVSYSLVLRNVKLNKLLFRCLSSNSYYVSTPIFYVNGAPHIGHLQSCLYADAFARIQRLLGKDVYFSTGTDEHGLKVQQVAQKMKKHPKEFCEEMSSKFEDMFKMCNVSYSHFIRTTDSKHKEIVQDLWRKLSKKGYIRKGKYEGWYSVTDEAFVPVSQVKEVKEKGISKMVSVETGSPVEKMVEDNYIFCLSKFKEEILHWLSKDVIQPPLFADIIKSWLEEGLSDLSISRPKSRLTWGIPVPDDDNQIIYVWLDALINYLTVSKYSCVKDVWPADCQVIGKDILKFHAIYWPAFLIAAGYDPPKKIFCHSHWTVNSEKMSKSKGNVIDPNVLIQKYGVDGFRYYLLRTAVPHSDTDYTENKIYRILNAELADTLGNLLSRSCAKAINKEQVFPKFFHHSLSHLEAESDPLQLIENACNLPETVQQHFLNGYFYKGIDCIMDCLRDTNALMQFNKPWELVKLSDAKSQETLSTLLHIVLEVLKISGILLQPVMPSLSDKLLSKLQVPIGNRQWQNITCFPSFHHLPNSLEGRPLGVDSVPLYERRKQN